ncbi:MAG: hypothetical protein PVF83_08125 [Anaerolineales bacterium]|jgi:hypothetical protein
MKISKLFAFLILILVFLTACGKEFPPTEIIPTPTFTSVPITHTLIPGDPIYLLAQLISDCTIGNGVTVAVEDTDSEQVILSPGCDRWDYNKIERPFEDTLTNYTPQSDISKAQIGYDDDWFFAQLFTYYGEVVEPQPMNGTYGIELDRDLDGRGEILILASQPGEEWDVSGVQVWKDNDTTVGAETPVIADEDNPDGGYDEIIFDAGVGDDPDLAWARISPTDPNVVQIAFKRALGTATDKEQFSWIMWAGLIDFVPTDFDYVDTFTRTDVYALDNTCSWTYGVPLQGFPNQCGIQVEEKPGTPGSGGCVQPPAPDPLQCYGGAGFWFWDANACEWYCDPPPG